MGKNSFLIDLHNCHGSWEIRLTVLEEVWTITENSITQLRPFSRLVPCHWPVAMKAAADPSLHPFSEPLTINPSTSNGYGVLHQTIRTHHVSNIRTTDLLKWPGAQGLAITCSQSRTISRLKTIKPSWKWVKNLNEICDSISTGHNCILRPEPSDLIYWSTREAPHPEFDLDMRFHPSKDPCHSTIDSRSRKWKPTNPLGPLSQPRSDNTTRLDRSQLSVLKKLDGALRIYSMAINFHDIPLTFASWLAWTIGDLNFTFGETHKAFLVSQF